MISQHLHKSCAGLQLSYPGRQSFGSLKRALQNELENPLAQKILSGGFEAGHTVRVEVKDGMFVFA